jgi:hypothetical protein
VFCGRDDEVDDRGGVRPSLIARLRMLAQRAGAWGIGRRILLARASVCVYCTYLVRREIEWVWVADRRGCGTAMRRGKLVCIQLHVYYGLHASFVVAETAR